MVSPITLPFAVIILRPFFLSVPSDLEAAARIDGCSQLGVLWRIVIPYVRAVGTEDLVA